MILGVATDKFNRGCGVARAIVIVLRLATLRTMLIHLLDPLPLRRNGLIEDDDGATVDAAREPYALDRH